MLTQLQVPNLAFLSNLFAAFFRLEAITFEIAFLCFVLWLSLFIALSKPIATFTAFSTLTAWLLGFGLSLMLAYLGLIGKVVTFLAEIFGFIGALIAILLFFTCIYILEVIASIKIKRQKRLERERKKEAAEKILEELGEEAEKR